jgi:hypothetical protein
MDGFKPFRLIFFLTFNNFMSTASRKKEFDSQLKDDSPFNGYRVEGNYIVFDNTADLDYQIIPYFKLRDLLTHNPIASYTKINKDIILRLERICEMWLVPGSGDIKINSSYRSPEYNKTVPGSSPTSRHCRGDALDLGCSDPHGLAVIIDEQSQNNGERGIYSWGCHIAVGGSPLSTWDRTGDTSVTRKFRDIAENDTTRNFALIGGLGVILFFLFTSLFKS